MPDERESTQEIARRVLHVSDRHDLETSVASFVAMLRLQYDGQANELTPYLAADLAELLRRAAAGECDP